MTFLYFLNLVKVGWEYFGRVVSSTPDSCVSIQWLTIQAACTASDTFPALGSHQKTWQSKRWPPASMMKANVCTSCPTPMNDRKRTRHSTSTSPSSWSETLMCFRQCTVHTKLIYPIIKHYWGKIQSSNIFHPCS